MPSMWDFIAVGYLRDAKRRSDFTFGKVVKSGIYPRHEKIAGYRIRSSHNGDKSYRQG
jgi:hypothetical protein